MISNNLGRRIIEILLHVIYYLMVNFYCYLYKQCVHNRVTAHPSGNNFMFSSFVVYPRLEFSALTIFLTTGIFKTNLNTKQKQMLFQLNSFNTLLHYLHYTFAKQSSCSFLADTRAPQSFVTISRM